DIFARSGIPFYVCPGTSSWNTVGGRTSNAVNNMQNAAENGLNHGATGYLITDWGDNGHWQPLPVSYLGFAYGAAMSWHYESNRDIDITTAVSRYAFRDSAEIVGRLAYDLGNVYEASNIRLHNGTILFYVLQTRPDELGKLRKNVLAGDLYERENYTRMRARIEEVMAPLAEAQMNRPDADLLRTEFTWAADMLRHACDRALWLLDGAPTPNENLAAQAQELIDRYQTVWLARNRIGGFRESVARMEAMRADYLL
ncbi:MAG: glycoside hydrolase, partial [Candidatus Promineifilaceae bacterium]